MCFFAKRCSFNAHIVFLQELTFVLHSFIHRQFAVVSLCGFMEDLMTAVIAEVLNMLKIKNVLKMFCDNTESEAVLPFYRE